MNWAHVHLMLNHLPVLGAPALLALLAWGLWRRSRELARAALWCTVLLGVVAPVVFLTGEPAEELVEQLPSFNEQLIERHEGIARAGTVVMLATGVLAVVALWRGRREGEPAIRLSRLVLVGLVAGTSLFAATAWTGGPIAHPELRAGPGTPVGTTSATRTSD